MAESVEERMRDDELHRFSLVASGLSISVSGDCRQTLAQIDRYLLPWIPRTPSPASEPQLSFLIARTDQAGRFHLRLNGQVVAPSEAMPYLFTLIQQAIDEALIAHLTDRAAVHAGVVTVGGRAILLPGKSGSGKTSLVHELVRRGAGYFSDEYAIIDSSGLVYPYPRALMVRDRNQEQHPVLATESKSGEKNAIPGLLLFLQYEAGADFDVHPISHGEALLGLLANTPHVMADKPEILKPLRMAASRSSGALEGRRGDVAQAADEILRRALADS